MTATAKTTMPKGCQFDHRLSFRRLPLGAFGKQDQDYDHDVFNSAGYTLARPHFGLENGVHLSPLAGAPQLADWAIRYPLSGARFHKAASAPG